MSLLQTVSPEQATGKVADIYAQIQNMFGRVPNGLQLFSVSPDLMEQITPQYAYYMQHPTLSFPLLALVRMLVSKDNDCVYCVGLNEGFLMQRANYTSDQIAAIKRDPRNAPLNEKDLAMLLFILKGTRTSKSVTADDVNQLRGLGWTDRDILDGLFHGARHVAADIMLNALKVEIDF